VRDVRDERTGPAATMIRRTWVAPVALTIAALASCAYVATHDPNNPATLMPKCPTKLLTGLDCPLCGGLRMVHNVIVGHWSSAVHDNLVLLLSLPLVLVVWVRWLVAGVTGREFAFSLSKRWTYGLLIIAGVWAIVRNLPGWPLKPGG
jgi:hypothetical protein